MSDNTNTTGNVPAQAVTIVQGNLNQTFPLPKNLEVIIDDKKYRFCRHCHTPKPVAQVPIDGKRPWVCINCNNGINNYDKLVAMGKMSPRPGTKIVALSVVRTQRVVESGSIQPSGGKIFNGQQAPADNHREIVLSITAPQDEDTDSEDVADETPAAEQELVPAGAPSLDEMKASTSKKK